MDEYKGQRRRAVIVHRRTELEELLDRHVTRGQVEFFLASRGRSLANVQSSHDRITQARRDIVHGLPNDWVVADVERADLDRFLFAPEDVIAVIGQDGLVANVAKYLAGQLVIGIDPEPGHNAGVLVRHDAVEGLDLLLQPTSAKVAYLATVELRADSGETMVGLNEVYLGQPTHQSARYVLTTESGRERQSSSGVIVATGAGSTGWSASLAHDRGIGGLPTMTDWTLAWFVREAWPSPATGVQLTSGLLALDQKLTIEVESDELVAFTDGIESDRLHVSWGQSVEVGTGQNPVRLAL
ncbi:MAG: hypothetical protein FWF43_09715 [Propionibacteriaceae bacterium]|nr:hypothetical protein [Propionibacteriaceae bacterium]